MVHLRLWLAAALLYAATAGRKQPDDGVLFAKAFLGVEPADAAPSPQVDEFNASRTHFHDFFMNHTNDFMASEPNPSTTADEGNMKTDQRPYKYAKNLDASDGGKETHVICRISSPGETSAGEVSVVVDINTNSRSLMFGTGLTDTGGETPSACANTLSQDDLKGCLATEGQVFASASDCPDCPCDVDAQPFPHRFAYMTEMANAVERRCSRPWEWPSSTMNVLMIGLGGGAIPSQLLKNCQKDFHVEGIELDGRVIDVATKYFGLQPSDSLAVQQGDGLEAVRTRVGDGRRYDAVLIDCFAKGGITPLPCRSEELLGQMKLLLKPKGFIAHHIWNKDPDHDEVATDFEDTVVLYKKTFGATKVVPLSTKLNDVVYASADIADIPSADVPPSGSDEPSLLEGDDSS